MANNNQSVLELVFIPIPGMGHLLPTVEIAQKLMARHPDHISTAVTILKLPFPDNKIESYIHTLKSHKLITNNVDVDAQPPITILEIPPPLGNPPDASSLSFLSLYMDTYKPIIKQALLDRYRPVLSSSSSFPTTTTTTTNPKLAGLVLDLFCTTMIDVGDDLGVPSYIFITSSAMLLSFMFHFESLRLDVPAVYGGRSPDETVAVPGFERPIPMKVFPGIFLDKNGGSKTFLQHATRFRRAKGILVNTFLEFEQSVVHSLLSSPISSSAAASHQDQKHQAGDRIPMIYPVGPVINVRDDSPDNDQKKQTIINWLDAQPPSSVVFLCFGSGGSFNDKQVKEIAVGLERSGQRFLWSLRRHPKCTSTTGLRILQVPTEYGDFNEVLPQGFLDRTAEVGRVIGWAPQVAVLAHKAIGAFVSHCGWNSVLESLWFEVPILAWPMYADHQLIAFHLVKEMGIAVEIRMDYNCFYGENMIVRAEEIDKAIRRMMEEEEGDSVRKKVKELSKWAKKAVLEPNGSSNDSMRRFVQDVLMNVYM